MTTRSEGHAHMFGTSGRSLCLWKYDNGNVLSLFLASLPYLQPAWPFLHGANKVTPPGVRLSVSILQLSNDVLILF